MMANSNSDVEGLLIAVGALSPNDQRLSKMENEDTGTAHNSIRSGKMFTNSTSYDDAEDDE